jgi:hypothetical protein
MSNNTGNKGGTQPTNPATGMNPHNQQLHEEKMRGQTGGNQLSPGQQQDATGQGQSVGMAGNSQSTTNAAGNAGQATGSQQSGQAG